MSRVPLLTAFTRPFQRIHYPGEKFFDSGGAKKQHSIQAST